MAYYLSRQHRLLGELVIAEGPSPITIDHRKLFRRAIELGAEAVVTAHNHPGGGIEPSGKDNELAARLAASGKLLAVPVATNVIVTDQACAEFGAWRDIYGNDQREQTEYIGEAAGKTE